MSALISTQPGGVVALGRPAPGIRRAAGRVAAAGASAFLLLVAALHALKPELDPSWRMVSEYAIGDHGWVMTAAFLSLAASCAGAALAVRSEMVSRGGKVGVGLLLVVAAALAAAGVFTADPMTAARDELTAHGNLHGLAAMIGIPGFPVAAVLISRSLGRNPAWAGARVPLRWAAHLTWISVAVMVASIAVLLPLNGGAFGPAVAIGWPNRLVVLSYAAWLITLGWGAPSVAPATPAISAAGEESTR